MPIGTSDGQYFEDDFDYHAAGLNKGATFVDPVFDGVYNDQPTDRVLEERRLDLEKPSERRLKSVEKGMELKQQNTDASVNENEIGGSAIHGIQYKPNELYNSPIGGDLTPEVGKYMEWRDKQSKTLGRDLSLDEEDYDMQGYYLAHPDVNLKKDEHLPDTFKKPNHPTFSEDSLYSGGRAQNQPGLSNSETINEGGRWEKQDDGSFHFYPGKTNLEYHTAKELLEYFKKYEKGNKVILPGM